jgi:hypothetical protein
VAEHMTDKPASRTHPEVTATRDFKCIKAVLML